jgi:hypothetical protein
MSSALATPEVGKTAGADGLSPIPYSDLLGAFRDRIICGDNCEVMRQMPEATIDLVLTSPPYDDLRTYLFANAVVWRDTVTDEEKQSIIAELKAARIRPRKAS